MAKKQHYMTYDERCKLEAYLNAKKSVAWIAREMGFSERTIYYEKKRGLAGIAIGTIAIITGIAILWNQRKIKKQLKQLREMIEKEDKP